MQVSSISAHTKAFWVRRSPLRPRRQESSAAAASGHFASHPSLAADVSVDSCACDSFVLLGVQHVPRKHTQGSFGEVLRMRNKASRVSCFPFQEDRIPKQRPCQARMQNRALHVILTNAHGQLWTVSDPQPNFALTAPKRILLSRNLTVSFFPWKIQCYLITCQRMFWKCYAADANLLSL